MGGPSLSLSLVPSMSSWSLLWALSAAIASVLDLRGARLESDVGSCGPSLREPEAACSGLSMGSAPSTRISRQVVKVVGGLAENSADGLVRVGVDGEARCGPRRRAEEPSTGGGRGGEPWCMGRNVETEREQVRHQRPPTRLRPLVALCEISHHKCRWVSISLSARIHPISPSLNLTLGPTHVPPGPHLRCAPPSRAQHLHVCAVSRPSHAHSARRGLSGVARTDHTSERFE